MEKNFKKGDMCIGQNKAYYAKGEITDVQMSNGSRKELIYKIGINWFFADELKVWYDGTIMKTIGADVDFVPNKVVKLRHDGIDYTIKAIKYNSIIEWCFLKVDKDAGTDRINENERGIGFYSLRPKQIERIYKEIF